MNLFKKISYLIFGITFELLLNNFLFGMNIEQEQYFTNNAQIKMSSKILKHELEQHKPSDIIDLIKSIENLIPHLHHESIRQQLLNINNILKNINYKTPEEDIQKLNREKKNLKEQMVEAQKLNNQLEVHVKLLLPLKPLNYIIFKIEKLVTSSYYFQKIHLLK